MQFRGMTLKHFTTLFTSLPYRQHLRMPVCKGCAWYKSYSAVCVCCGINRHHVYGNLRSGVIIFFVVASLLLWLERETNNAWYIHLTSRHPPTNLHNLTSARPVMLLANHRLRDGNQIFARICLFWNTVILRKRKFLTTSMFRWSFLKKMF